MYMEGFRLLLVPGAILLGTVLCLALTIATHPPALKAASLDQNLIVNGSFQKLKNWSRQHASNVPDQSIVESGENYVIWERTGSRNDGGILGVYQDLNRKVSGAKSLVLSFDVWLDHHTLRNTGWWSEQHDATGEMPVKLSLTYLDEKGKEILWDHGFLLLNDRMIGVDEATVLKNFTLVPKSTWNHFSFDLMDDRVRRTARDGTVLPRPMVLKRIHVHGSGWDFRAAVGNLYLLSQ